MTLHYQQFNPENGAHAGAAKKISEWSQTAHMLPLTPDGMAAHVLGLLAFEGDPATGAPVVGYRAVTQEYEPGTSYEIGAMVVDPGKRGSGYGSLIAAQLVETAQVSFPEATLLVFCNPQSVGISRRHGFEEVTDVSEVPLAALELCAACPMQATRAAGQLCCDTILALKPALGS